MPKPVVIECWALRRGTPSSCAIHLFHPRGNQSEFARFSPGKNARVLSTAMGDDNYLSTRITVEFLENEEC